jgi:hypothetical protein
MIKEVTETFEKLIMLHRKKNEDYTGDKGNPFFNFDVAGDISKLFIEADDKVFATMVGIKLGRIAALRSSGKRPNHESVLDSFDDAIVYLAIWKAKIQQNQLRSFDGNEE